MAVHTVLLGVVGIKEFDVVKYWYVIVVLGVILSYIWYYQLKSCQLLNAGKFQLISEMEQRLPFNMYSYEWEFLRYGEDRTKYWPISHLEKKIPIMFFLLYIAFGIFSLLSL